MQSVSIHPDKVLLRGADQTQQLVITGEYANGGVRDLTTQASYRSDDPRIVRIGKDGLLTAVGNGTCQVIAEAQGRSVKLAVTVEGVDRDQPINFANEIVPIFSKLGCNAGACHGKASGQNGFKLSVLGFEPRTDYEAVAREGRGRRVFPAAPEASLLLRKPTGAIPHGGGKRLKLDSRDYSLLRRWIRSGMPYGRDSDPKVVRITVTPNHRLVLPGSSQQIAVTAHYSDGSHRDVTPQAEYSSNDTELVESNETGLIVTRDRPGSGAVMVRYLGHVAVFRATIPLDVAPEKFVTPEAGNFIDQHVFARLKELGLPPSEVCSDGEFLRRVSLDINGTLPTAAEAEKFLADTDPKKREQLVEQLLNRPAYVSYFALKWGDILRNRRNGLVGVVGGQARTAAFDKWIRDSIRTNKPYDQFVREILTAKGDLAGADGQAPVAWYNVLRTPQALVDDTAQVFLGTRIQCAQCHHHPYEKWSQDDYWGMAAFFARVQIGNPSKKTKAPAPRGGKNGLPVLLASEGRVMSPQGKFYSRPRPLGGTELDVPADEDPRKLLVDWMVQPDNPFFARAIVNRYWSHFFGRGIVEMPDDMRVTNPPSNPQLLDALAKDFVDHHCDVKHLIRTICTSRIYQLSSTPNAYNARDRQNFARFYPRRLPAEVLSDAIDQVTDVPTRFGANKGAASSRAIDLPDEAVKSSLLASFGKPVRASACECERSSAATLTQSLYLIGSADVHNKLKNPKSRAAVLAADARPPAEKIRELYLWVYARRPTAEEEKLVEEFLNKHSVAEPAGRPKAAAPKQRAYEDLLWALLNTKEFLFNH